MTVVRQDRPSRGGGVALYYNSTLICEQINLSNVQTTDVLFCSLALQNKDTCLVAVVYRPPNSKPHTDEHLILTLRRTLSLPFTHVLLMGDFNVPTLIDSPRTPDFGIQLAELIDTTPLYNHISAATRHRGQQTPSTLDLVLTNEELMVENVEHLPALGRSDHSVLSFNYVTYAKINKPLQLRHSVTN